MSDESPIGRLLEMTSGAHRSAYDPPEDQAEPQGTVAIYRFEDLEVGLKVFVWDEYTDSWASGEVYKIRSIPPQPNRVGKAQACVKTARGRTRFFYDTSWERTKVRIRGLATGSEIRQAAMRDNFGHPGGMAPIDGTTPPAIFATFVAIMREEISPVIDDPKSPRFRQPRLTSEQLAVARSMWSARLAEKTRETRAEAARRERERVVVDDDRWEI